MKVAFQRNLVKPSTPSGTLRLHSKRRGEEESIELFNIINLINRQKFLTKRFPCLRIHRVSQVPHLGEITLLSIE